MLQLENVEPKQIHDSMMFIYCGIYSPLIVLNIILLSPSRTIQIHFFPKLLFSPILLTVNFHLSQHIGRCLHTQYALYLIWILSKVPTTILYYKYNFFTSLPCGRWWRPKSFKLTKRLEKIYLLLRITWFYILHSTYYMLNDSIR